MLRKVIVTCLGHVDHGKSSLLDKIRNTAIVATEAGGITQAIGASVIPLSTITKVCGKLLKDLKMDITVPGLLTIDTPGHAAFTNLRKRGGNLADIAILVIDINEGLKPQTYESIEILKKYKTPFIIAANKIDLIHGWQRKEDLLLKNILSQEAQVMGYFEQKLYEIIGKLQELGLDGERFDRVSDYTKQIAIVPISAKSGEGVPELLMVLTGLAQKFLEQSLKCNIKGPAKCTILEVKEEKGLGTTLDIIVYDGTLRVNDTIVIGDVKEPIVTKVRALLEPASIRDMRDKKSKFNAVKEVRAAIGVKISAPGIDNVIAGMPIKAVGNRSLEEVKQEIMDEIDEVIIKTDKEGIVIKADTLGSLEALIKLLKEKGIAINRASIGDIMKKDLTDAESNADKDPLKAVILGFNIKSELISNNIKIITSPVIYKLIEEHEEWLEEQKKCIEAKELEGIVKPFKFLIMKDYVFRQKDPAVCGVEVLAGTARTGTPVMNDDGKEICTLKEMQHEKKNISKAEAGKQVAMSFDKITLGRNVLEGDKLYSAIRERDFRKLKKFKKGLSDKEKDILREIAKIKRVNNPLWGV